MIISKLLTSDFKADLSRVFLWTRFIGAMIIIAIFATGCSAIFSRVEDFTLKDAQAAKARAVQGKDPAGELCWTYIETKLAEHSFDLEVVGLMDAIEVARIARIRGPELQKEATEKCGQVFADVLIELAKRGAKRGL